MVHITGTFVALLAAAIVLAPAISGFGQQGPMRGAPAYDQIIQGLSGMMSITGGSDTAPLRVGYPVADTLAGMTAAFAISSALVRQRACGEGAFIEVLLVPSAGLVSAAS